MLLLAVGCKGQERDGEARPAAEAPAAAAPAATTATPAAAAKQEEPAPREAAIDVDVKKLLGEYHDNEVRADSAFKGKLVQTSGVVGDVKKDITGSVYVTVGTGAMLEIPVVQCFIADGEAGAAAALSKGQKVTVRGRVGGLMMNVLVRDCEINPMMKLCKRLVSATGGTCKTSEKPGDPVVFEIGSDANNGAGGIVACASPTTDKSATEVYETKASKFAGDPSNTFVGSKRAGCFSVLFQMEKGKPRPVDDGLKAKAQAFFDTL
ncbi:hypothetical protein WME98_40365 [Sorangium sp. So ce296]|uniref:OB-fold protein n=1 Tax=Sorangium sp. So ce296 TaxID=3133296 RepID=UPI003F5F377A